MKRLLWTLFILLLAGPALADAPEEALSALHPGLTVTSSVVAGEDAFFLLQAPDDTRSLCVLRETDGAWTELLHSESVISPPRRMETHSSYWYDDIDLIRDGATLSLRYSYRTSAAWQYDFARDEAGTWRFVRLTTEAPTSPVLVDVLTYEDGCVHQTFTKRLPDGGEEATHFAPCPMPWLADMLTLADFDASAFPMDVSGMPEDMLTRVAAELLPEYTFVDGCFSDGAAFLMDKPTGERVFMGGEYRNGAWIWVESQPLPEGTLCDSYHGSGSVLPIAFPKPNPSPDWDSYPFAEWSEWGEVPYNEYVLYRQEDGGSPAGSRWLICTIGDEEDDFFHFEESGLYHNTSGMAFGEYLGERDISKVDWQSVPHTFMEALALMSPEWGVVGVDRIPLRSGPGADMQEMALCRFGAPVEVLAVHDGWANVSVLRGALTGWLPEDALLLGAEQMIPLTVYDDMWGFDSDVVCAAYAAPKLTCFGGTSLLDAPEGGIIWEDASNEYMQLVCECPDGWVLVCWPETLSGGFIRAEFTTPEEEAALSPALAREYFPEDTLVYGEEYEGLAMLLLDRPDGTRVLACGANEDGAWSWTESSPLPAGTLLAVNNSDAVLCLHEGETEFCVIISHDEGEWRITELQDSGFNWMYTDGMLMAEDGTAAAGLPGFDTDIRRTDWSALPTTLEDALDMLAPTTEVFLPVPEGCRLEQGWTQKDSAMYLLSRADGSLVFAGYALTPDGWVLTESTPLPEGSALDPGYVTHGSVLLNLPDGRAAEISLRDGAWHVVTLYSPALTMGIQPHGFGAAEDFWYGDLTFPTDVTQVDWAALPATAETLRACLDTSAWRIIAEDTQALRTTGEMDTYRRGTAVRLIYQQDGLAAVSVLGGDVIIMVPADVLVSADTQFEPELWEVYVNPWFVPRIFLHADAASVTLYDSPGGEALHVLPTGEGRELNMLADCSEDGWLHVESAWDHVDGYVHEDDLPPFKVLRKADSGENSTAGADTCAFLMQNPDGETVFVGGVKAADGWTLTRSTPLPEGSALDTSCLRDGYVTLTLPAVTVDLAPRDGTWRIDAIYCPVLVLCPMENGLCGPEGSWYGDLTLETDVTKADWAALPATEDALIACVDVSAWRIISEDTPARRADGSMDTYRRGTAVRLISQQDGQATVAVLGGDVIVEVPADVLVGADTQFVPDYWVEYVNRWFVPSISVDSSAASVTLYDFPGGEALHVLPAGELRELNLLADCAEDGWFHVESAWDHIDGYVHVDALPPYDPFAQAGRLLPGYLCLDGVADASTCAFLMQRSDGETVFVGGSRASGSWAFTESQPLPEGADCDPHHSGFGTFILRLPHPDGLVDGEGCALAVEYTLSLQDTGEWLVTRIFNETEESLFFRSDGVYISATGTLFGPSTLDRDIRHIDWAVFPTCLDEVLPTITGGE